MIFNVIHNKKVKVKRKEGRKMQMKLWEKMGGRMGNTGELGNSF